MDLVWLKHLCRICYQNYLLRKRKLHATLQIQQIVDRFLIYLDTIALYKLKFDTFLDTVWNPSKVTLKPFLTISYNFCSYFFFADADQPKYTKKNILILKFPPFDKCPSNGSRCLSIDHWRFLHTSFLI